MTKPDEAKQSESGKHVWLQTLYAILVGVALCLLGYVFNHEALGGGVFIAVPLLTGFAIAFMSRGREVFLITALTTLIVSLSILFFTGLEGVGCVFMAFPILGFFMAIGAAVGYLIAGTCMKHYGNSSVIILCLASFMLIGWVQPQPAQGDALIVKTTMEFHAPMNVVWETVMEPGRISGSSLSMGILGMPIPERCEMNEHGQRLCYFDQGEIIQDLVIVEPHKKISVHIVDATFQVRSWITFQTAMYEFTQEDGYVRVTRTDEIASTLRPRWYWSYFETQCVQLEHRYVLHSMKEKCEN